MSSSGIGSNYPDFIDFRAFLSILIYGFSENVQQSNEYGYDLNGNLNRDDDKGYDYIDYNYLNLPWHVGKNSPNIEYITYIYDATGTKLAKIGTGENYTWYAGGNIASSTKAWKYLRGV